MGSAAGLPLFSRRTLLPLIIGVDPIAGDGIDGNGVATCDAGGVFAGDATACTTEAADAILKY